MVWVGWGGGMAWLDGGWAKWFDFEDGGGVVKGEGLHSPPIFAIRETMTIAYIKELVTG